MAPINDEDIDPALHSSFNDTDPSMQFFARCCPQPDDNATSELGEHNDFQAHSPAFQDSQHEDDDDTESQGIKAHDLVTFSKMILQRKKLSHKATTELNIYCETSTPFFIKLNLLFLKIYILTFLIFMLQTEYIEEHLALHYVLALENQDLLKEFSKPEQWVISEDLKVSLLQLSFSPV